MKKTSRIFWGLGFITAAVFLVLSQMHLITAQISVWSALIGILCVALLVSSIADGSFGGIFFSLGLAWLTFAEALGLPKVGFWNVVIIVVFLTVGFNFLFPHKHRSHGDQDDPHARRSDYTKYQKVTEEEGDGFVECSNSFGETTKYVNMSDLKRGHFQNSFGEMKVYLDQAHMAGDSVTIEVSNSFGQLTLFIPKEWNVVQKVSVFAASVDEKRCGDSNGPICYLKGSASFGEIEIVYV